MWKILGDGATGEPNSSSFAEKTYLENVRNNLQKSQKQVFTV